MNKILCLLAVAFLAVQSRAAEITNVYSTRSLTDYNHHVGGANPDTAFTAFIIINTNFATLVRRILDTTNAITGVISDLDELTGSSATHAGTNNPTLYSSIFRGSSYLEGGLEMSSAAALYVGPSTYLTNSGGVAQIRDTDLPGIIPLMGLHTALDYLTNKSSVVAGGSGITVTPSTVGAVTTYTVAATGGGAGVLASTNTVSSEVVSLYSIPIADGEAVAFDFWVAGHGISPGRAQATLRYNGLFQRIGSTINVQAGLNPGIIETPSALDIALVTGGGTSIGVHVTGAAGTNMTWTLIGRHDTISAP